MDRVTSRVVKLARRRKLYVGFAWIRDGEVVYRDSIRADSVERAIEVRFGGKLPDGFVVEKVVETPEIDMLPPGSSF